MVTLFLVNSCAADELLSNGRAQMGSDACCDNDVDSTPFARPQVLQNQDKRHVGREKGTSGAIHRQHTIASRPPSAVKKYRLR